MLYWCLSGGHEQPINIAYWWLRFEHRTSSVQSWNAAQLSVMFDASLLAWSSRHSWVTVSCMCESDALTRIYSCFFLFSVSLLSCACVCYKHQICDMTRNTWQLCSIIYWCCQLLGFYVVLMVDHWMSAGGMILKGITDVKVKCNLVQALRLCTGCTAHRGSRGIALPFLDHGTRRGWGVSVTPRPLFTRGKHLVWVPGLSRG
jgi:hypothetical protein